MDRQFISRLTLIFMAGFLFAEGHQNWIRGKVSVHLEVLIMVLVSYGFAFFLLILAGLKVWEPKLFDGASLCATMLVIITSIYIMSIIDYAGAYRTDALAFSHYAAILYLKGQNPYVSDLQEALSIFSVDPEFITLTVNGDIITSMNYPSLHFLLLAPAVALGIPDMRIVLLIFELAVIAILFLKAPEGYRGIALIPLLAGSDLAIGFTSGCVTDFLWVLPCTITALYLERPKLSGFAYGIACAIKQTPWIVFPFLAIWHWRTAPKRHRLTRLGAFSLFTAAGFIIPNLRFILWDWSSWLTGVLTPITGGLIFLSRGISTISQFEVVPLPPSFYLICFIAVLLTLIFNYFYYFESMKDSLWILPGLALWFSYRALQNYFIYWIPMLEISIIKMFLKRSTKL